MTLVTLTFAKESTLQYKLQMFVVLLLDIKVFFWESNLRLSLSIFVEKVVFQGQKHIFWTAGTLPPLL